MLFRSVLRWSRIALCVGVPTTPALSGEWTVNSGVRETVEVNDNYFMVPSPKGATYAPLSSVFLDVLAQTPTSRYALNGDFSYLRYFGPGAADTGLQKITQNGLSFDFEHSGKAGNKVAMSAWWRQSDVAAAQLADIGAATASGQINTHGISGNILRQLSATDEVALSAAATAVSFSSASLAAFSNLTSDATWKRHLDPALAVFASAELNWTIRDAQVQSADTRLWKAVAGVQTQPIPRLTLSGSAGVGLVSATAGALTIAAPPLLLPVQGTGNAAGFLADLQAAYKLFRTTQLSVTASRSITPGVLGELSQRTAFGMSLAHDVNALSSVSLSSQFTQFTAPGATAGANAFDLWSANASYQRRLTREWRSQLTYTYRQRSGAGGPAKSNSFILLVARDMTLLH